MGFLIFIFVSFRISQSEVRATMFGFISIFLLIMCGLAHCYQVFNCDLSSYHMSL